MSANHANFVICITETHPVSCAKGVSMSLTHWQQRFEAWLHHSWNQDDKAHDVAHFRRVWKTAQQIMAGSEANRLVVLTACYFHDIVNLPKNHPQRPLASTLAAQETLRILETHFPDFPREEYDAVAHAVRAHSFSAGITPAKLCAELKGDYCQLDEAVLRRFIQVTP